MRNFRIRHLWSPLRALLWAGLLACFVFAGPSYANEYKEYSGDGGEETEDGGGESFFVSITEDFLGSASRVGALVGSLLGGAAYAHPFSPIAGSVIGYFVGKSSDFSGEDEDEGEQFARQSFAPAGDSTGQMQLALNDGAAGGSLSFDDTPGELASNADTGNASVEDPDSADGSSTQEPMNPTQEPVEQTREPVNLIVTKQVGSDQEKLDELAAIIRKEQGRPEFSPSQRCPERDAPRYRKKLAVAGFTVEHPEQTVFGDLSDAGPSVSKMLYQHFEQGGKVLPYSAPRWQMYASLENAPTTRGFSNRLGKYSAVSREMGAQFVVSGVVRSVALQDRGAWDTSTLSTAKRQLFGANTQRGFVVDVVVHDGFTGRVVMEKRYEAAGAWDAGRYETLGFGSARFSQTAYGQAVEDLLSDISKEVSGEVACQPMLVPILEVDGREVTLDVGTASGLLPGDALQVVRAGSSWTDVDAPPRLTETGVDLRLEQLSLNSAYGRMQADGDTINIQRGDYAVIY